MYISYLTVKQFSEIWGISERRIIKLCTENRIVGAMKNGMVWLIPEETLKPSDKRSNISKYINTQKRIIIINIDSEISTFLIPLLIKEGFIVEGIGKNDEIKEDEKIILKNINTIKELKENSEKYYDGLIYLDSENNKLEKKEIIDIFSKKMNCESSIVIVENEKEAYLETKKELANKLKVEIGLRINCLKLDFPVKNTIIDYNEIAEDIVTLTTKLKNTTGQIIKTNGGCIEFDKNGKTNPMEIGTFYKTINHYFKKLNKGMTMWCASTMLEDEWTEEPAEMKFRVTNLEAANRGANIERIFIFSKNKIKEFKKNKTLKIYMQSNIKTMFVDYDEIKDKRPELLKIVGNGWDGIDLDTLIVDLPEKSKQRGYVSINKKEVEKAYKCFQELKKYSKDLKEVLK